jgi:hypothetical protein
MRDYARETRVVSIPGRRADLFLPPAVDEVARQLSAAIRAGCDPNRFSAPAPAGA